jgi:hypothetical protein
MAETERTGVPEGSIGRLLHDMTVGTIQAIRGKDASDAQGKLREIEQQFQVAISGTAIATPAFTPVTLNFDYPFYYAPAQRDSNLEFPHFLFGSHTNPAVGIHASVTEWLHDETNGSIIGAVVQVAAIGEGAFTGFLHASFQGLGALAEEDQIPLVGEG